MKITAKEQQMIMASRKAEATGEDAKVLFGIAKKFSELIEGHEYYDTIESVMIEVEMAKDEGEDAPYSDDIIQYAGILSTLGSKYVELLYKFGTGQTAVLDALIRKRKIIIAL